MPIIINLFRVFLMDLYAKPIGSSRKRAGCNFALS